MEARVGGRPWLRRLKVPRRRTRSACRGSYMERRTKEGLSKKEIIRCLKRYIARELYQIITKTDRELAA
ncbi:hypothetical protein ACWEPL_60450 [Nonomuraea sp. NPDC004186]